MELSREISELVARFIERVAGLAREITKQQLTTALGDPPPPGRARRAAGRSGAVPQAAAKSRRRRSPSALDQLRDRLLAYVVAHPGQRIEQINAALGTAPGALMVPMKKLLYADLVRTEGERRTTRYYPGSRQAPPAAPPSGGDGRDDGDGPA